MTTDYVKRIGAWVGAILAIICIAGWIIWHLPSPQYRIVQVATIGTELHLGTSLHFFSTTTGEVVQVYGDDWVKLQVGHCYRIDANRSQTEGATEVPCQQ